MCACKPQNTLQMYISEFTITAETLPGNKIYFYYYYFHADPPEHRKRTRLPHGLIQDGEKSVPLQNYFSYFYSKSVFKSRNLVNLN